MEERIGAVSGAQLEQRVTLGESCDSGTQRGEEITPIINGLLGSDAERGVGVRREEGKVESERGRGEEVEGVGKRREKGEGVGGRGEEGGGEGGMREAAAQKIQGWYRSCHHKKRRSHVAEVQSLLQETREGLNHSLREQQRKSQQEVNICSTCTILPVTHIPHWHCIVI